MRIVGLLWWPLACVMYVVAWQPGLLRELRMLLLGR